MALVGVTNQTEEAAMFLSKKQRTTAPQRTIIELADAKLDGVTGGLSFGGPGYGISTAFFYAGAQPQSFNVLPTVVPTQAAPSPTNTAAVAGGLVTAGSGNPSQLH